MSIERIKEGTYYEVEAQFFDSADDTALPESIRYRIDCLTSNQQVRDWTSVTIGTIVYIKATPDENAILVDKNMSERKQMTVQSNYGTDNQTTESIEWLVVNLKGHR